ncbi:MAG TPA: hypothetical protein G4N94_12680 [Caldilineae bacterium]|nr:hypothetical protein [Caldilineae bacterium]
MFKPDKFTWTIIIVVVLVLAAAVITVNLTGGAGWGEPTYLTEDTPEAAVHNAFVAFMKQDYAKARQYYSAQVLDNEGRGEPFPGKGGRIYPHDANQRLRIRSVDYLEDGEAIVTVVIDYYAPGGLFGGGDAWSRKMVLRVVREEDGWKIDTPEFFY